VPVLRQIARTQRPMSRAARYTERRAAICKRTFAHDELEEVLLPAPKPPSSPATVFAVLDDTKMPEITPLPGSWLTVGKKGRPIKDMSAMKMYDPPSPTRKKQKKKRRHAKKDLDPIKDLDAKIEQASTSAESACYRASERRAKKCVVGKDERFWARYRQAKRAMEAERDLLFPQAEAEEEAIPAPAARRDPKKRRPATKARHHARLASRDARCYPLEGQEDAAEVPPPPLSLQRSPTPVWVRRPRKEEGASSEESGWRIVGKRGKPLRAKREEGAEPSPAFLAVVQSAAQQAKGKKKCSIM